MEKFKISFFKLIKNFIFRKYFLFLSVAIIATFLFSGITFSGYFNKFFIDISTVDVTLGQLESKDTIFSVYFNPDNLPTEEINNYRMDATHFCDQYNDNFECIDPFADLCPYISVTPNDGEESEFGFDQDYFSRRATGQLIDSSDMTDNWTLSIKSPCFEGECPLDYDESQNGAPLPSSLKGKTFKCDISIYSNNRPVLVRNYLSSQVVYADDLSHNTISISALFTGELPPPVRNPVIIIPGITASYLNRDYGDKSEIWPDIMKLMLSLDLSDSFLNDLALNEDGSENIEYPIKVGDIIRGVSWAGVHVFDNLIEAFINDGYKEDTDLFVFPYDWRKSSTFNAGLLKDKIDSVIAMTGIPSVDIIAHSMGGIITKKYIADNGSNNIDQLVFLGTPQLGSPKSFKVLMFGDNMGYGINLFEDKKINFLNIKKSKEISQNMPSVYELLPSKKYIKENGSYIINALSEIILPGTSYDLDYEGIKNLMLEKGRNNLMFPFAENLHDSIDDLDLSGVKSYNFVGCGSKTIGEIKVEQKRSWKKLWLGLEDDFEIKYVNGDETVPINSANKTIGSELFYVKGISHGALPSPENVIKAILSLFKDEVVIFDDTLKDNDSYCGVEGEVVSVHSPVDLHIYDKDGNHTGPNENGDIEYGIDGVVYDIFDGEKYAFLPKGIDYRVVTDATDTGGYDFKIEEQDKNDNIINTYDWTLIPLSTLDTVGEVWIGPDYPADQYEVRIDKEGDGSIDDSYKVDFDGTSEAESLIDEKNDRHIKSGSTLMKIAITDKEIELPAVVTPIKDVIKDYFVGDKDTNKNNFNIIKNNMNIDKTEKIEKIYEDIPIYASAGDSTIPVKYVWGIGSLILISIFLVAKRFIK